MTEIMFEENDIYFMQDSSFWKGIPEGVKFVTTWLGTNSGKDRKIKLVGKGYGELGGDYGNGAIFVFLDDTGKYKKRLVSVANQNRGA